MSTSLHFHKNENLLIIFSAKKRKTNAPLGAMYARLTAKGKTFLSQNPKLFNLLKLDRHIIKRNHHFQLRSHTHCNPRTCLPKV